MRRAVRNAPARVFVYRALHRVCGQKIRIVAVRYPHGNARARRNPQRIGVHAVHMRVNDIISPADRFFDSALVADRIVSAVRHMHDPRAQRLRLRFPRAALQPVHEKIRFDAVAVKA